MRCVRLNAIRLLSWLVWSLCFLPRMAFAQEEAAAEALFRSAREAAKKGDWRTACDRFRESHRLEPAAGTVLNLARCREELGQIASAWKRYREVVQRLPPTDRRVAYAEKKEVALLPRVPHLIVLPPEHDGEFLAVVDGIEISEASFGVPLPFDPGEVAVEVRAPNREIWTTTVELEEGARVEQKLQLGDAIEEPVEPPRADGEDERADLGAERGSGRRTWGFTAVGLGTAGVMTGTVGAIWSLVELNTVGQHCLDDGRCDSTGYEAGQRGQSAVIMTAAGFGVGAVGLGLGLYLLNSEPPKTEVGFVPLEGGGYLSIEGKL